MTLEPESVGRGPSAMEAGTDRVGVAGEDGERAIVYRLLATALEAPVGRDWLEVVGALPAVEGPFGAALKQLSSEARVADPATLRRDYHDLFIGVGRGELVPYASYYLTGFLNEKPLALLRQEMRRLGIERSPDVSEPEDHIAALCEMMAGLVEGSYGEWWDQRPNRMDWTCSYGDCRALNHGKHFKDELKALAPGGGRKKTGDGGKGSTSPDKPKRGAEASFNQEEEDEKNLRYLEERAAIPVLVLFESVWC